MGWLHLSTDMPPSRAEFVGVAIKTTIPERQQRHVALVYRKTGADDPRISHLCWHETFRDESWAGDMAWLEIADLANDALNSRSLVGFLHRLRMGNPLVPYGFMDQGCLFRVDDVSGRIEFVTTDAQLGLTCASFITCVFRSIGLDIVDEPTWPAERPGDAEFRKFIIDELGKSAKTSRRAKEISVEKFDVRIRPEDVASAAAQGDWPVQFDQAKAIASEIVAELDEMRNPPRSAVGLVEL